MRNWNLENITSNHRGKIGAGMLTILFLVIILITGLFPKPAKAQTLPVESGIIVTVSNGTQRDMQIRLESLSEQSFMDKLLQPGESQSLRISSAACHHTLQVFVNGRFYGQLEGNLCPELFPDEQKGVYFWEEEGKLQAFILHEDRN